MFVVLLAIALSYQHPVIQSQISNDFSSHHHSISLPQKPENFVGREEELRNIINLLNFSTSDTDLVSIVGSPGFGKSALAVSVAHELLSRGVTIYYVDMAEVSSMQDLAGRLREKDEGISMTLKEMYIWARKLQHSTLLLLDNCEDVFNRDSAMEELWRVVKELFKCTAGNLKILTTSRQVTTIHSSAYRIKWFSLRELRAEASCSLLKHYSKHLLTDTQCETMANLTGHVPLALKVLGSLFHQPNPADPDTIFGNLEEALIPTLSPVELLIEERVSASINASYEYLTLEEKIIGRYLANFPGYFNLDAAVGVIGFMKRGFSDNETKNVLCGLVQRSLLNGNKLACHSGRYPDRFHFHQLISEFFHHVKKPSIDKDDFRVGFISFFTNRSMVIVSADSTSALEFIGQNKQNLLYFFQLLEVFEPIQHGIKFLGIKAVSHLYDAHFLHYSFNISELRGPTRGMFKYLKLNYKRISESPYAEDYLTTYVSLLLQLTTFEEELGGISMAFKMLESHQGNIEQLLTQESGEQSIAGSKFFKRLAEYYERQGEVSKANLCREKGIELQGNTLDCRFGVCSNTIMGQVYYTVDQIENVIRRHRLAEEDLDLTSKAHLALYRKVITLYTRIMNMSDFEVYKLYDRVSVVVKWLRMLGTTDEANILEEKQLAVLSGAESKVGYSVGNALKAVSLVETFHNAGQYSKCVNSAHIALNLVESIPDIRVRKIGLWKTIFHCQIETKNYSGALISYETLHSYIISKNNITSEHVNFFGRSCIILMLHGAFTRHCTYDLVTSYIKDKYLIIFPTFPDWPRMDYYDHMLDTSPQTELPSDFTMQYYFSQTWYLYKRIAFVKSLGKICFRTMLVLSYCYRVYYFVGFRLMCIAYCLYPIVYCLSYYTIKFTCAYFTPYYIFTLFCCTLFMYAYNFQLIGLCSYLLILLIISRIIDVLVNCFHNEVDPHLRTRQYSFVIETQCDYTTYLIVGLPVQVFICSTFIPPYLNAFLTIIYYTFFIFLVVYYALYNNLFAMVSLYILFFLPLNLFITTCSIAYVCTIIGVHVYIIISLYIVHSSFPIFAFIQLRKHLIL